MTSLAPPDRSSPPKPGRINPFSFPEIRRFHLNNGLPVLFSQTKGPPVTTLSLLLPAGARREQPEQAGLAKLTSTLLESGTADLTADALSAKLESMGVHLHSGCSWELAHIDFTCLSDKVGAAAQLLSQIVRSPAFPNSEVERLKGQLLAGIVQRRAEPGGFANLLSNQFIFAEESPYSRPIAGRAATVSGLDRDAIAGFHDAMYTPQGGALVVAGSLDVNEVRSVVEGALGDWNGGELDALPPAATARFPATRVIVVDRPGAVQSEIRIGHLGAARDTTDYFAILVMNTILGGAFSSRLNLNLREKNGFTYGVRSQFAMRREPGPFVVATAVQTEVTAAAVREIFVELDRIREGTVKPAELNDARQYVAGTFPLRLQTSDSIAGRLAELFIYDLPDRYLAEFPSRILEVTEEQVLRAARTYIRTSRAIVTILGDAARISDELAALDIAEVEVIKSDEIP